ncbi:FYVE, RhoGEF and PH domain-containing protein 6-like protein [Lates japonicus]|uniref:FYVE, RhoGEF and PH domain-containing protein 6-like protein n=1 Tax=Lates japonicus TaxID=270547 RepID=A0AAD3RJU7_LATJO|nr:FYVE, RhoGEF and PH domain-containing protein 6-like protein [Lates japonicus]
MPPSSSCRAADLLAASDRQRNAGNVLPRPLHQPYTPLLPPRTTIATLERARDFRDAVSKASRQNGKPVIEERLLNQILYYLPQLYELNQDLLRELKQRLAKWYIKKCFYF